MATERFFSKFLRFSVFPLIGFSLSLSFLLLSVGGQQENGQNQNPPKIKLLYSSTAPKGVRHCDCLADKCRCLDISYNGINYIININYAFVKWPRSDDHELQTFVSVYDVSDEKREHVRSVISEDSNTYFDFDLTKDLKEQRLCEDSGRVKWNPFTWENLLQGRRPFRCFSIVKTNGSIEDGYIEGVYRMEMFDEKDRLQDGPIALYAFKIMRGEGHWFWEHPI